MTVRVSIAALLLACSSIAGAATDYCTNTSLTRFIDMNVAQWQSSELEQRTASTFAIETRSLQTRWGIEQGDDYARSFGFDWRYSIVDVAGQDSMTNGYQHHWRLPFEGREQHAGYTLHYEIAPALALSSNALKNPQLWGGDSLQLATGAVFQHAFSGSGDWLLGLRADHRFGDYRAYPVVGLCLRPGSDWIMQLALPDLAIRRGMGQGAWFGFFVRPAGETWHVFSRDEQRHSDFIYRALAFGITGNWMVSANLRLVVELEQHSRRELEFSLNDLTRVETDVADELGFRLRGIYRF